ncbi:MAG: GNAT family N-acetyltransferase [Pseudomonadota bacterium]
MPSSVATGHCKLRKFTPRDSKATYKVFYKSVREGTSKYYSQAERLAWAGSQVAPADWAQRLDTQETLVAEMEGRIVGFMSLRLDGYLDMAYVLPNLMGSGIAKTLFKKLEAQAIAAGLTRLTTDASYLARSFFLSLGWNVLSPQMVRCNGCEIQNFRMEKRISDPNS